MTQLQEKEAPGIERAEHALSRAGERIGRLVGQAGLRIQRAARSLREEADRMDEPASAQQKNERPARKAPESLPATARAEELVDRLGQRMSHWATVNGLQARRAMARLREDAEDMWVEAQEMRNGWMSKGRQP
jgi:uncharacterized membrane protein YccC